MSVVILGGGVSGLSAAFYLLKETAYRVTVVESNARIGGWISSQLTSDGVLFEQGARTLRPMGEAGLNTLKLIEDLNMSSSVNPIPPSHPAVQNRFICVNGQLHPLRMTLGSLFFRQPPFSKSFMTYIRNDLATPPKLAEDDSIYEFTKRRFGEEVADYLVSPLICGICAGDAKAISVRFLLDGLYEHEQKHGSVVKGFVREFRKNIYNSDGQKKKTLLPDGGLLPTKAILERWLLYTLKGGMQSLPLELAASVERMGGRILLNTSCEAINLKDRFVRIDDKNNDDRDRDANDPDDGKQLNFDYLISSLPAYKLAALLEAERANLANELRSIPYVTVATVNLAYKGKLLKQDGFGFLVPPRENLPLLGVTFDSCYHYESDNDRHNQWTVLTAMLGGFSFEQFFGQHPTEEYLLETAAKYVNCILGIADEPVSSKVSILRDCIPQYVVGHKKRVHGLFESVQNDRLPLFLIGNSYHGVGVNDVIFSAKKSVERLKEVSSSSL